MRGVELGTVALLVAAGFLGAAINGVVGAGTLITFPTLIAVGASPVVANATNTLGLSPGSWSSAFAYRAELGGRRRTLVPALAGSVLGAAIGAILVLALPERVFEVLVPWLILTAALLVAAQPLVARVSRRPAAREVDHRRALPVAIAGAGVYGGYFGAGQGVVLMGLLGLLYDRNPQHANAAKNLFAAAANITAAGVFLIAGRVWWWAAVTISIGAVVGGTVGAKAARLLPGSVLRAIVVVVGIFAAVIAWWRW
jgi:uncharacterized protein